MIAKLSVDPGEGDNMAQDNGERSSKVREKAHQPPRWEGDSGMVVLNSPKTSLDVSSLGSN